MGYRRGIAQVEILQADCSLAQCKIPRCSATVGHDTPAIIESMIRILSVPRWLRWVRWLQAGKGKRNTRGGSRRERMLDCRVGVGATVNDCLCRLYIGPCESQALIQRTRQWNSDYGLPAASTRSASSGREEKPFVCSNSAIPADFRESSVTLSNRRVLEITVHDCCTEVPFQAMTY